MTRDDTTTKPTTKSETASESNEDKTKEEKKTEPTVTDPYAGMTQRQIQAIKEENRQAQQKIQDKIRFVLQTI